MVHLSDLPRRLEICHCCCCETNLRLQMQLYSCVEQVLQTDVNTSEFLMCLNWMLLLTYVTQLSLCPLAGHAKAKG